MPRLWDISVDLGCTPSGKIWKFSSGNGGDTYDINVVETLLSTIIPITVTPLMIILMTVIPDMILPKVLLLIPIAKLLVTSGFILRTMPLMTNLEGNC